MQTPPPESRVMNQMISDLMAALFSTRVQLEQAKDRISELTAENDGLKPPPDAPKAE